MRGALEEARRVSLWHVGHIHILDCIHDVEKYMRGVEQGTLHFLQWTSPCAPIGPPATKP